MDDIPPRKLSEIRREYMKRILAETGWDYREASAILKISEKFLRKQVQDIPDRPTAARGGTTKKRGR